MMADGRPLLEETARSFEKAMHEGFSSINYQPDPVFTQKLTDDIWVFSGCKTYRQLKEVTALLVDENGKKKPFADFKADVQSIYKSYNENYLKAEYKNAVSTSRMAASWKKWEKDADAYNLQYRTAGDSEVRESHKLLNRITLPMDDPFWNYYVTPLDWGCRCRIIRVLKERYEVSNSKEAAILANDATRGQEMFKFNPGKQAVVFPPAHPYYQLKEKVGKLVDGLLKDKQQHIEEGRKKYNGYNKEWSKEGFDEDTGGYNVYHIKHQFSETKGGGDAEKVVGKLLKKNGKQVEFLPENGNKQKKPDMNFDGKTWDTKYINDANENTIRTYIKDGRKADCVIFYWDKNSKIDELKSAVSRSIGHFKKDNKLNEMPNVYYMNKDGELKPVFIK
jgi:SPP1 gp7 family putative phage head morphogenesis protein